MKLPFSIILRPILKPHLGRTRQFCGRAAFRMSVPYTYFYGILGLLISANHLRKHLGETPSGLSVPVISNNDKDINMLIHDLKVVAMSMGLVQYVCVVVGCVTENPALFLPHLFGQLIIIAVEILNILLLLAPVNHTRGEDSETARIRLRTLLVALLGMSMSACAFASQPVELELEDDDVAQRLNNVSFARRITKPTIRLVMGYSKLSACVTAISSLLLLVAVMSKQSWWRRGARWLAAPALLVAALEATSDASDAMLAAALRGSSEPARVAAQTAAAGLLVTAEILVWYFIAKFFEYDPPTRDDREKENLVKSLPHDS